LAMALGTWALCSAIVKFCTCSVFWCSIQRVHPDHHLQIVITRWERDSSDQEPNSYVVAVRPRTSWSSTFCSSVGHLRCRTSGSLSVTTQSDGTSQLEGPSSPMIVTDGNWRDRDVTIQRWAERSASVCKSFLPYNKTRGKLITRLCSMWQHWRGGACWIMWWDSACLVVAKLSLEQCFVSLWKIVGRDNIPFFFWEIREKCHLHLQHVTASLWTANNE
jgi:hypothetical protein